jgi:hypothetical protein
MSEKLKKSEKNGDKQVWQVPAAVVARLAGTSRNNVEKIRRGTRGRRNGRLVRRVKATDRVLEAGIGLLLFNVAMVMKCD